MWKNMEGHITPTRVEVRGCCTLESRLLTVNLSEYLLPNDEVCRAMLSTN